MTYDAIPLVYVAGPYRASTASAIDTNIMHARELGKLVAAVGAYPIIPHANTAHFDGCAPNDFWLPATLAACARCDGIIMRYLWPVSVGSVGEHALMTEMNRAIFYENDPDWEAKMAGWIASKDWKRDG